MFLLSSITCSLVDLSKWTGQGTGQVKPVLLGGGVGRVGLTQNVYVQKTYPLTNN